MLQAIDKNYPNIDKLETADSFRPEQAQSPFNKV